MKALSIKQPWASLICTPRKDNPLLGINDIENRTWRTHFRGKVYIHASAKIALVDFTQNQIKELESKGITITGAGYPLQWLVTSAIIGEVEIIDCVVNHHSIWAEKTAGKYVGDGVFVLSEKPIYNWVLANPVLYDKPILNVKGKLSFWEFEKLEESEFCECSKPNQSLFPDGTYKCINEGCFKTWYY